MTGNIDDVVHATQEPEIAVGIALGAVAGEVDARPLRPVLRLIALRIAPDTAQHRWPGTGDGQIAAADLHLVAALIEDLRVDAGKGARRRAGFGGHDTGQRRD